MRKSMSLLLVTALLLSLFAFPLASASAEPVEIVVFHTNDVHARVLPDPGMGYAMAAGYVDAARSAGKNVLLLDAGDTFHGLVIATAVRGESIVNIMNAMKYDAMAPGNHDFNYGLDRLQELSTLAEFPLLSCNVLGKDGKSIFAPYAIQEIGGVKIGLIGVETPEMVTSIHPSHIADLTFADGVEYVTKAVEEIKDQTDAIIVLAHWGQSSLTATSDKLAEIPGVDLVIDGHSHTVMPEGKQTTGGLVASTGEYLKNLGKVTLTIDGDKVTAKAELIPRPEVFPSKNIASTISSVEDAQKVIFEEVVGKTSVALDGERANVRTGETNMGDLICDAIADGTGADVVLTNGGGIRASIDVGDITRGEVITVLPFGNYVVTKTVTGKILKDALEFGLQKYPDQNGGFPHVAGLTYQFDPSKEVGSRLVEVLVGGEALDESKSYVLATNDFMAAGGDGYVMFKDAPIQYEFGGLDEMLVAYLQKTGEVSTAVDGRITSVK